MPEYEQCRRAAREANVPLRVVAEAVLVLFNKQDETGGQEAGANPLPDHEVIRVEE